MSRPRGYTPANTCSPQTLEDGDPRLTTGMVEFKGGTRRSSRKPMYHLVPIEIMRAIADTRVEGDLKYEPGNWKQGSRGFFIDCLNHTIEHLYDAVNMESREDVTTHLGHAACNIAFMLWALARDKLMRADFTRAAVIVQEEEANG